MSEHIKLEVSEDKIAIATMVNGENRFRTSFVKEWMDVLDKVERDITVKALIIQGEGKYFSLGLDLEFLNKQRDEYWETLRNAATQLYWRLFIFPVPTVAIINGHAFGAGAFLALSCDFRVMRPDRGWLCWPETALGMQIRPVSMAFLRAKIPNGCAQRDAIVFAQKLTAQDAKTLQLVDVISSEDKLHDSAFALIKNALGPRGLDRKSLSRMKRDIYGNDTFSKL